MIDPPADPSVSKVRAGKALWAVCLAAALWAAPSGATSATSATGAAGAAGAASTAGAAGATHPAAGAAASPAPAGQDAQERVLDVTLVPPQSGHSTPASAGRPAAGAPLQDVSPQAPAARRQATAARRLSPAARSSPGLPLAVALLIAAAAAGRIAWRRRPRRCTECGAVMRRLDGAAAFAELDMAERTDHLVGEVRYKVWRCGSCGAVTKSAATREVTTAVAAAGAPVGSATYLRRQAQSGLSIMPPRLPGASSGEPPSPPPPETGEPLP
jgi:hypothetical protein